jgi:cytochrome c
VNPVRIVRAALLLSPVALAPAPAPAGAADEGERAFQKCYACHSVREDETAGLPGPNLRGVVGRRAAAREDFEYSPALREAGRGGLVWSEGALDAFLADPAKALPGTTMSFVGLRSEAERSAVIDYLKRRSPR